MVKYTAPKYHGKIHTMVTKIKQPITNAHKLQQEHNTWQKNCKVALSIVFMLFSNIQSKHKKIIFSVFINTAENQYYYNPSKRNTKTQLIQQRHTAITKC